MSFAPTRSRGARLNARFAVNGIQCASSGTSGAEPTSLAAAAYAAAAPVVCVIAASRVSGRRGRGGRAHHDIQLVPASRFHFVVVLRVRVQSSIDPRPVISPTPYAE